jgi:hypothetical protein
VEGGEGGGVVMSLNGSGAPTIVGASGGVLQHGEGWKGEAPVYLVKHGTRGGAHHDEAVAAASW